MYVYIYIYIYSQGSGYDTRLIFKRSTVGFIHIFRSPRQVSLPRQKDSSIVYLWD